MTSSMSHGNRWRSVSSKLSLRTRLVCVWTSFSINWSSLFLLWEWIHPSIDHQCSHTDTENMTPETLYVNQTNSLNRGSPVFLSVTPSTNVAIQVAWGSLSMSGVKTPWSSSLTSSSKRYYTSNVVSHGLVHDRPSMCTKKCYGLHCHLLHAHSFHKHLIPWLHLAQILALQSLRKILAGPFLIIVSFQHSTNSEWSPSVSSSAVCSLSRHGCFDFPMLGSIWHSTLNSSYWNLFL